MDVKGKPSMLGAASGAVAGLVAITPAAGNVGMPGAFVIGLPPASSACGASTASRRCSAPTMRSTCSACTRVGGIFGALADRRVRLAGARRPGLVTDWVTAKIGSDLDLDQFFIQAKAVGVTIIWTAVVAFIAFKIADMIVGLRVTEEDEREGLDISVARRVRVPHVNSQVSEHHWAPAGAHFLPDRRCSRPPRPFVRTGRPPTAGPLQ